MVLICSAESSYPSRIDFDALPAEREVYVEWDRGFGLWHQTLWGTDAVPQIQLEIMSQLQMFVAKKDVWAVVLLSAANGLYNVGIRQLAPVFSMTNREIYALQRRAAALESAQIFLDMAHHLWDAPHA